MAYENVGDYLNAQQVYSLGPLILKGQLSLDKTFDFEMFSKNNESANRVLAKSVNVYGAMEEMIDNQNNGNFQKAIDIGHEAIKSHPYHGLLLSSLSSSYLYSGNHSLAHYYIKKALKFLF